MSLIFVSPLNLNNDDDNPTPGGRGSVMLYSK
jgi:hypothetical protein